LVAFKILPITKKKVKVCSNLHETLAIVINYCILLDSLENRVAIAEMLWCAGYTQRLCQEKKLRIHE